MLTTPASTERTPGTPARAKIDLALFNVFAAEEGDAGREDHGNEGRGEKKIVHFGSPLLR